MNALPLVLTVFVACAVEAVEALTIVLAAGLTREWRSAFQGMGAAFAVLAAVVAVAGPALTLVPLAPLRLIVGALLAVFGLQWLRKAILRASGYKDLHDEEGIYARQVAAARAAAGGRRGWVNDWYAFTLSFKGVLLEGLEVVFIAITFGASQQDVGLAALSALAAVAVVAAVGVAVHAPLSRVPENSMKFAVGVMLTSFGVFWGAEGAGASWPGDDAALLVIVPMVVLVALGLHRPAAARPGAGPGGREGEDPDERLAALVRRVLVRLHRRRRLARGGRRCAGPGRHRPARPRRGGECVVADACLRRRRAGLVAAPRHHRQALSPAVR